MSYQKILKIWEVVSVWKIGKRKTDPLRHLKNS